MTKWCSQLLAPHTTYYTIIFMWNCFLYGTVAPMSSIWIFFRLGANSVNMCLWKFFFSFSWRVWLDGKQDRLPTIYWYKDNLLDMWLSKNLKKYIQFKKGRGNFLFTNCFDIDFSVNFDLIFNLNFEFNWLLFDYKKAVW